MADEKPNLEGRLYASVGDLILLSDPEKEASGYVRELKYKSVTLSHESPTKPVGWSPNGRSFFEFSRGDRTYHLQGFTDYEVLRKANQE